MASGNTTGNYNTATGGAALVNNTTGFANTAVGFFAGVTANGGNTNTTGSNNTFIGFQAGPGTPTQLTNSTAIGANAVVSASNTLVLGSPGVTVAIGASTAATTLQVIGDIRVGASGNTGCIQAFNGSPIAGTCSSDARLKQDIEPLAPVLDMLSRLQPVTYSWRSDEHPDYHFGSGRTMGLIAQEVEVLFPNMVTVDQHGYKAVNYSELPLLLLQALREQQSQIQQMLSEIESLKTRLKAGK
jgi:Chaperone of endosialidase